MSSVPSSVNNLLSNKYSTQNYYIEYNKYFFNHLAHGAIALSYLKCPEPIIEEYMKKYSQSKLSSIRQYENENHVITYDNDQYIKWNDLNLYLGKREKYYNILEMYQYDLKNIYHDNINQLIYERFNSLSYGIGCSAFHGLIHVGYGIFSRNIRIILEGISFITYAYLPFKYVPIDNENDNEEKSNNNNNILMNINEDSILNILNIIHNQKDIEQIILNNCSDKKTTTEKNKGTFQEAMIILSKYGLNILSRYVDHILHLIPNINNHHDLKQVSNMLLKTCIEIYSYCENETYNDFFLLHGVTSAWSLYQLLPWLPLKDTLSIIQTFLLCLISTYAIVGSPFININIINNINVDVTQKEIYQLIEKYMPKKSNLDNSNDDISFLETHSYKLMQVVLFSLHDNIIDTKLAYLTINKCLQPFVVRDTVITNYRKKTRSE